MKFYYNEIEDEDFYNYIGDVNGLKNEICFYPD